MFDVFFVTLRESVELSLILASLRAYLASEGRGHLAANVKAGVLLGLSLASLLLLFAARLGADPRVESAVSIVFAVAMMLMAVSMLASASAISAGVDVSVSTWLDHASGPLAVAGFTALAVTREAFELALFLRSLHAEVPPAHMATGVVLGFAAVPLLWLAYRRVSHRARLFAVFRLSALLLALMSVETLLSGLGAFVVAHAERHPQSAWTAVAGRYLGDEWHAMLCVILMLAPACIFARGWWHEAAPRS
ncbi:MULTISPECIES: FTR1 family protein [Cupriavidus]